MINPMELTGKHVLITGGSSGIGRQCAIQASRLGARVTLISRREEKLQETIQQMDRPEEHACYSFDLNETGKIEALVKTIVTEQGPVDGFCHAAGISALRPIRLTKPAFVEEMFRVNEYAFIELVRCLSLKKNLNDGASLVGISSVAAKVGDIAQGAYAASKASVEGFIHSAAKELAPRGIRINAAAFALVATDMYQGFLDNADTTLQERQLLGVIDVDSAANAIAFLLSDACKFITESTLPVYAGYR